MCLYRYLCLYLTSIYILQFINWCKEHLEQYDCNVHLNYSPDGTKANLIATLGSYDTPGGLLLSGHTGTTATTKSYSRLIRNDDHIQMNMQCQHTIRIYPLKNSTTWRNPYVAHHEVKWKEIANTSKFITTQPFINIDYNFLEDFIFNFDYTKSNYQNKTLGQKNTYEIANATLSYKKENSAWSYKITAQNLFNAKFKQSNSFSDFLISDTKTFILPRIIMFSIGYNL